MRAHIFCASCYITVLLNIFFISCKTSALADSKPSSELSEKPLAEKAFLPATSLDDLDGIWETADGNGFEYPFICDGRKYLRYYFRRTDDTWRWQRFAANHGIILSSLWQKRFACAPEVYEGRFMFPVADEQDMQYAIKIVQENSHIYGSEQYLIPERILAGNLAFFVLSEDRKKCIENGTFHTMSTKFPDIIAVDGAVYEKK